MSLFFDYVIYHEYCPDGITSLWVVDKYHQKHNQTYQSIGCSAGKTPSHWTENELHGKSVLFVDTCPSVEFLLGPIAQVTKQILVLDHHKSALDSIREIGFPQHIRVVTDMNLAGCQITWDTFFTGEKKPWFIDYVADRDLWKWELPNSKAINTGLYDYDPFHANDLTKLYKLNSFTKTNTLPDGEEQLVIPIIEFLKTGNIVLRTQEKLIDEEVRNSVICRWKVGDKTYTCRAGTISRSYRSEFGNRLVEMPLPDGTLADMAIVYSYQPDQNVWYISLRGGNHSPDLSQIAKQFGGGGHAKASGFETAYNPFSNLFIPI